eukprot:scaffold6882_cov117-Isochrysis_galbana.AAC.4
MEVGFNSPSPSRKRAHFTSTKGNKARKAQGRGERNHINIIDEVDYPVGAFPYPFRGHEVACRLLQPLWGRQRPTCLVCAVALLPPPPPPPFGFGPSLCLGSIFYLVWPAVFPCSVVALLCAYLYVPVRRACAAQWKAARRGGSSGRNAPSLNDIEWMSGLGLEACVRLVAAAVPVLPAWTPHRPDPRTLHPCAVSLPACHRRPETRPATPTPPRMPAVGWGGAWRPGDRRAVLRLACGSRRFARPIRRRCA